MPICTSLNFRRLLLALALAGGLATAAQAQAPANDDPCGAVALTPQGALCTAPTTSTNAGATTTAPSGYANTGTPRDVWFRFTTAASGPASFGATITVNGNPAGTVQLLTAATCAGPFAVLATSTSGQANTTAPRLITGTLQPTTTYYLRVYGTLSSDTPGAFTICVSDGPGSPVCAAVAQGSIQATYPATLRPGQGIVTFTPGANNIPPFVVTISGQGIVTHSYTTNSSPVTVDGLIPGGSQTVTVTSTCALGGTVSQSNVLNVPAFNRYVCDAQNVGVNPTCVPVAGNLYNSQASGFIGCGQAFSTNYQCQWYKFTTAASGPASTQATVTLNSSTGANEVQVWSGNPCPGNTLNALTLLGCATNTMSAGTPPLPLTGLLPGTTYYVQVGSSRYIPSSGSSAGLFTLCVTAPGGCTAPSVSVGSIGATSAVLNTVPLFNSAAPTGYTVTYQAAGGPTQTVTPAPAGTASTLTGLLPGTTYTATVTANCAGGGTSTPAVVTFTTLATAAPCFDPDPVTISAVTGNAATVSFATAPAASGYVVMYQAAGSSVQTVAPAPTASPVALSGLLPSTAYTVLVQAVCAAGPGTAQAASFTTLPLTASNDNCATALPLAVNNSCQSIQVTTAGATQSTGVPAPSCASFSVYDVWYTLVVPANGTVQVTTGAIGGSRITDTALALYSGTCGSLVQLGCNDDYAGGGDFSQLRLSGLVPGATLYARTWALGVGGTGGPFTICAQTDGPPTTPTASCAAPTGIVATALSPRTASVSFVPGTGSSAIGYTVTATPAGGGAAITATGAASPVALAGLAPGTSYTITVVANCAGNLVSALATAPGGLSTPLATQPAALAALVTLSPNPAHHSATIHLPAGFSSPAGALLLRNSLGQLLRRQPLRPVGAYAEAILDLTGLAPGVYVVQLPTTAGLVVKRLVIE